jgi:hypothetical protein
MLSAMALFALAAYADQESTESKEVTVTADTFKCLADMTPVKHFFVDNLLGNLEGTVAVANSDIGGTYPKGSVVQLFPDEIMVKHGEGWNSATRDWEFFEIDVTEEGNTIRGRGFVDVVNRFGGNCFGCHVKAKPEWDMICGKDHGCDSIPVTSEEILQLQQADPRCRQED